MGSPAYWRVSAALHAVMPFALAASGVTAAPVSFSPLRSVVLHYTPFRSIRCHRTRSLRLGYVLYRLLPFNKGRPRGVHSHKLHSLPTLAHCTSFRFISSSFTQPASVHPLPLLCSPALSFGLRAVMLFASRLCWPTPGQLLSTTNRTEAKKHASPCVVRSCRRQIVTFK